MVERTLVFIKPDGLNRKLVGRILTKFEEKGLQLVALNQLQLTGAMADTHYQEHIHQSFYPSLREYVTSGPIVALVLEAPRVIEMVRHMVGVTDGAVAALGTIRGDFAINRAENIVHASDSPESATREIAHFFPHLA